MALKLKTAIENEKLIGLKCFLKNFNELCIIEDLIETGKCIYIPSSLKWPSRPWEHIAVDFKGLLLSGDYLLVVIGEYSMFDETEITKPAYLWF